MHFFACQVVWFTWGIGSDSVHSRISVSRMDNLCWSAASAGCSRKKAVGDLGHTGPRCSVRVRDLATKPVPPSGNSIQIHEGDDMPGWKYGCNSWQLLTQHVDFTKKGALLQKQSSVGHSDLLPRSKIPQLFEWIASRSPTPHCRCYKSANHLHPKIFPSTCEHIWILPSKHANPCSNTVWNLLRYHSSKEHGFYYRLGISILKKSFNPVGSGLSKQVNDFSNLVAVALMASSNILDTYARPWKSKTGTADENPCHLSKLSWVGFPQAEILSCQQLSTSGPCNNTFSLNGNWANYFNSWLLKAPMSTSKHTVMNFVNWSQLILLQHDRPKQGGKCCHSWTLATFDRRKLTRCVLEPHGDPGHKAKASAGRFHTMHNKNIQTCLPQRTFGLQLSDVQAVDLPNWCGWVGIFWPQLRFQTWMPSFDHASLHLSSHVFHSGLLDCSFRMSKQSTFPL